MKKENKFAGFAALSLVLLAAGVLLGRWTALPREVEGDVQASQASPLLAPGPGRGMVTFLTGEAFRLRESLWEELEVGDLVEPGDTVKVVENAVADLQFGSLAVLRLRQNSSAAFEKLDSSEGGELVVRLVSGTGLFTVRPGAGAMRVETSAGVLKVTGTEFLVQDSTHGVLAAVSEGSLTGPQGTQITAGRQVRYETSGPPVDEEVSASNREILSELSQIRRLDVPDTGIPRMARVVVETSPRDALILLDDFVSGRGRSSLLVPFGETLHFTVAKTGYKSRSVQIPVVSAEAEKTYLVRLELDPSPEIFGVEVENLLLLKSRIDAMEKEIESRETHYQALSGKLKREGETSRREAQAALNRVAELESQTAVLSAALAAERERVRQVLELLQEREE